MTSWPCRSFQADNAMCASSLLGSLARKPFHPVSRTHHQHTSCLSKVKDAKHVCRKLYADEKAKLLARRNSKDQAKSASAQAGKVKPGVSAFSSCCVPSP